MVSLYKVALMFLAFLLVSVASLLLSFVRIVIKFNDALKLYRFVGIYPEKDAKLYDANKERSRVMSIIAETFDESPYLRKRSRKEEVTETDLDGAGNFDRGNLESKECESGSLLELYSSEFSLLSKIACIRMDYCKIGSERMEDPKDQINSEAKIEGEIKNDKHGRVLEPIGKKKITSVCKLHQAIESETIENRVSFRVNDNECEIRPDGNRAQKDSEVWTLDQKIRSTEFLSDSSNLILDDDLKSQVLEIASGQNVYQEFVEHKSFDHVSSQGFVCVACADAQVDVGREISQPKSVPWLGGLRRRVVSVVSSLRRSVKSRATKAKKGKKKSRPRKQRSVDISKPVILRRSCRTSPVKSENLD